MSMSEQAAMMHLNMYGLTILSHSYIKNAKKGDSLVNISSFLALLLMPVQQFTQQPKRMFLILATRCGGKTKSGAYLFWDFAPELLILIFTIHQEALKINFKSDNTNTSTSC